MYASVVRLIKQANYQLENMLELSPIKIIGIREGGIISFVIAPSLIINPTIKYSLCSVMGASHSFWMRSFGGTM